MSGAAIEQRTYWLSFCDSDRPRGQQFLGACVVQVTSDDVARALAIRPDMYDPVKGPWIAAAVMVAWAHRCNPGGEVASVRVDDIPGGATPLRQYPRNKLLTKAEIVALDDQIKQETRP